MKLKIEQGNAESEYTLKDLQREANNAARKAGGKVKDMTVVVSAAGVTHLKVLISLKDSEYTHTVRL